MAMQSWLWNALESRQRAPSQHDRIRRKQDKADVVAESGPAIGPALYRPRETRSISALTMRSTSPGKLSSSQDFSIGRSISLTRSSSVRALLLSTVWASVLNADSTADTVECDRICCGGALLCSGGGSNAGCRCSALAAALSA